MGKRHDTEPERGTFQLFDGMIFDPNDPLGYLNRFTIRHATRVEEAILPDPATLPV